MVTHEQIVDNLRDFGGNTRGLWAFDDKYVRGHVRDVLDSWKAFKRYKMILRIAKYIREQNDCEDFSLHYKTFMNRRFGREGQADPTGVCLYNIGGPGGVRHAINFRDCVDFVLFIEPQSKRDNPIVELTSAEISTLSYVFV